MTHWIVLPVVLPLMFGALLILIGDRWPTLAARLPKTPRILAVVVSKAAAKRLARSSSRWRSTSNSRRRSIWREVVRIALSRRSAQLANPRLWAILAVVNSSGCSNSRCRRAVRR